MIENQLRISYSAVENTTPQHTTACHEPADMVHVPARDVIQVLAHAIASERSWLRDFEDDVIALPYDLFEVLQAYRDCQQSSL